MKFAGVVFSILRGFEARCFFTLTATLALFLFIQISTSVSAQEDAAATHDSHTGLAAAQLDHQHPEGTTHEHNVEHLLELLNVPEQVDNAAGEILKLYTVTLKPGNTDPTQKLIIDAYQQDATRIVYGTLGWANLKTTYIYSYANRMNEQDVAAVTDFLTTPGGQKFIASQADAGIEIQQTTKHLMEADMSKPLAGLASRLREGLAKVKGINLQTKQ